MSAQVPTIATSSVNMATVIDLGSYELKVGESVDQRPQHGVYSFGAYAGDEPRLSEHMLFDIKNRCRPIIKNGQVADFDALEAKLAALQREYYPNMFGCVSLLQPFYAP